ncbi:MAG: DUF697 domain-containing protein [Rhodobacteraceae bacterium]|nr:DUF697 domain-containing protein [Paracoccaceae bacterium]
MSTAEALAETVTPVTDKAAAAHKIIKSSCMWAAASGAVPVPVLDAVAMGAVQATMVNRIAELYGHTLTSEAARSLIAVVLGTILPAGVAGAAVGSGTKFIPGFGWFVGSAAMGSLGYAATYAIGRVFVRHFEAGGTPATFTSSSIDKAKAAEDLKNAKRATDK